jgi:hypothetical protein
MGKILTVEGNDPIAGLSFCINYYSAHIRQKQHESNKDTYERITLKLFTEHRNLLYQYGS